MQDVKVTVYTKKNSTVSYRCSKWESKRRKPSKFYNFSLTGKIQKLAVTQKRPVLVNREDQDFCHSVTQILHISPKSVNTKYVK